ncbi:MAG: DUF885 family protein [Candidatus Krumholzibacteriota bacterium]|nr:DUF885 family protein [Candidatus Krumholzibacteriota bacterium]
MNGQKTRFVACSLALFFCAGGCGAPPETGPDPFIRIESLTLRLYERIHPLRASRLGFAGADSLLFTFDERCVADAAAGLDSLLALVDSLSSAILGAERRTDVARAAVWAQGQLFSLRELGADRRGPVLYCWMAEEALEGIPYRSAPPREGEAEAYAARISQLPRLLENAAERIVNPPLLHVDLAAARLDGLIGRFDALASRCEARWGARAPDLDAARAAVVSFRRFVDGPLRSEARGGLIIGAENFARVLRYDEGLVIDPVAAAADAEKSIRRYNSRWLAVRRSAGEAGGRRHDPAEILAAIDAGAGPGGNVPAVRIVQAKPPHAVGADPFLAPPAVPPPVAALEAACPVSGHLPVVFLDPTSTDGDAAALRIALFRVSANARDYDRELCRTASPLGILFASRLARMAFVDHVVQDLVDASDDDALRRSFYEDRIRALAVLVVTMRLHGGSYTSEAAAVQLRSAVPGMTALDAASIVAAASIDPSIAYPGIAILLSDELVRKASFLPGGGTPREKARRLLLARAGRPLPDIVDEATVDRP